MKKLFPSYLNILKFSILLSLTCLLSFTNGQNKKLEKGIALYEMQNFVEAIDFFKKARKIDDKAYLPVKYLANSFRKIRDYENAELYYVLTVNSDSVQAEDYLYYGQALKANGKLAAAKNQFLKFAELSENEFLGNIMLQSIDEINTWEKEPKEFKSGVESDLNSPLSEYGLVLFKNLVYFTSNRDINQNSPEASSWDGSPYYSMYEFDSSEIKSDEKLKIKMVSGLLNTEYHDGPLSINEQETKLIITRIDNQMRGKDFLNRMKMYTADYENDKWKNFKPFPFNSDEYSVCQGHLADSGKTLYFASDMPGGQGGFDLYRSNWENNQWSKPQNLGKNINTPKNEVFPYYRNNTLYFSSDGFAGYGGLDIMYAVFNETWQSPKNMKSPINSNRDDFSIYFVTDSTGFYASNREGGKGADDLYRFTKQAPKLYVDIHGVYEYKGLPKENVKVLLLNQKDSIVYIKYTDSIGQFHFKQLPYKEEFFVRIEEQDEKFKNDGRLFITDKMGNKLRLLNQLKSGKFTFQVLPTEEFLALQEEEEADTSFVDGFQFLGRVYKKLPGDFSKQVMVYLTTKEGLVVDSAFTDQFGYFNFEKLGNTEDYLIQLKELDPGLNLALENKFGRVYEVISPDGEGVYAISNTLDASLKTIEARNNGITAMIARIEHKGLPLKALRVNIYNALNQLIGTVYTNNKGEFQFNKLEFDDTYYIEFPELEGDILYESLVYTLDSKGDPLYLISQLKNGKYVFNSLPFDEYKLIQEREENIVPLIIKIAGQVYKKLPGDFEKGITVYALDNEGTIVDSVLTDSRGRFNFEKLDADKNYAFKLKEEGETMNMAFLDENNKILELATLNKNGSFSYKKLTYQIAQFEPLAIEDVVVEDVDLTQDVTGLVYQKLPGDFKSKMKVFVYNEEGELLAVTETDKKGNFTFEKLKKDVNYIYKIEDEDDPFQLVTLDKNNRVIDKTIRNRFGQFKYSSLSIDNNEILLAEARDHYVLDLDIDRTDLKDVAIHYRFDSTEVRPVDRPILQRIISEYKDATQMLEVHSYTDNRGSKEYNIWLSKQRTNQVIRYLVRNGFPRERIIGNYSGMLNPIVDCESKECNNDDHYLNRRTEFKILKTLR
ncbi:MAG: hypothetical protein DWP98_11095 [Bacteroidetes bacterium]|nr:MAG: hypothetical protein DWP98_11095 [Bacteroidota bacterium]MBL1143594.1 hypothetical protein [Bacteroidota bacterium]NOG56396.1 OmpA family protein [Bacteroidota bacterium]